MFGGSVLLHQGQGQVQPSTYVGAERGDRGRRAVWGQSSTCLGAGGVSEVPGEPWLPVPVGCWPCRWGREAGLPLAPLSVGPGLSGPPPSLRILNKFLDGYQEDVLPWHECVEPCLSSLSAHSSDREVRGPRDSWQAGAALPAVPCISQAWRWWSGSPPAAARPCCGQQAGRGGERLSWLWLCPGGWRAQRCARPGSRRRCCDVGVRGRSTAAPCCWGLVGSWRRAGCSRLPAQQVVQEVVGFLHRLATASKDCAVVMCRVGTHEALSKALEKHSKAPSLAPALLDLVIDCEKYASLYKKLTTSILAGCIQVGLGRSGCAGALGLGAVQASSAPRGSLLLSACRSPAVGEGRRTQGPR